MEEAFRLLQTSDDDVAAWKIAFMDQDELGIELEFKHPERLSVFEDQ
jgi:hypothetical protein